MGWIRRNKGDAAAAVAIAVGLLAVVLGLVIGSPDDGPRATPSAPFTAPFGDPTPGVRAGTDPTPAPTTSPVATIDRRVAAATPGAGLGTGSDALPGLPGTGGTKDLPKQRITMTMRSAAPIGTVGYVVPTSLDHAHGVVEDVGTSWSLSTVGYGAPDYAQLFAQSGPTGAPITCTITVNGKVTESRSTDGPYSQLFCQG